MLSFPGGHLTKQCPKHPQLVKAEESTMLYSKRQLDHHRYLLNFWRKTHEDSRNETHILSNLQGRMKDGHKNISCSKANDVLLSLSAARHLFYVIICLH